jgi:hypothetical protein
VKIGTFIRPFSDTTDDALAEPDPARAHHEQQVREARLEAARNQATWEEIPETRLVPRSRFWVDAETDQVYALRAGSVFVPGSASVGFAPPNTKLEFFVNQAGEVVFLDTPFGTRTWSEIVLRRARR